MVIVILKELKDLEKKEKYHKYLPDNYPIECVECESKELANEKYPGKKVYSKAEYQELHLINRGIFIEAQKQANKKWWNFLSKNKD